jgi:hypothetical protein
MTFVEASLAVWRFSDIVFAGRDRE